ncbi:MAG: ABC transporter permease [Candidatus Limnocylindrales bacterium]
MDARRILAIARRISQQFRRDRRSLALLVVAPLAVLALLGYVIRDQQPPPTVLGIVSPAGPAEEPLTAQLRSLAARSGIGVVNVGATAADGLAAVRDGRADVVVVLPVDPTAVVHRVQVITLGEVPADDAARVQLVAGMIATTAGQGPQLSIARETVYGSASANLLDTFAPALIGFFGFFFVFILTGISFLRERTGGTLERLLATPVRRSEIVVGYSLGFGFFATIQVALILAFALGSVATPAIGPLGSIQVGLGIANAGSPLLAYLVIFLAAIGAVNLAIFLSTFAATELQVIEFIPIVIVPQAFLGGVFWSVGSLPGPLQPVAHLLPMTYAIDGLRAVLLRSADLSDGALRGDVAFLAAAAVAFVLLAGTTIKREVS